MNEDRLRITVGGAVLHGLWELEGAPRTCAVIRSLLPLHSKLIHVRWSGEAAWIPMGDVEFNLGHENHTSHPYPGQLLLYPGGISEVEMLMPYGGCSFSSRVGQLAANHFATIVEGLEHLPGIGHACLWEGAQDITLEIT